MFRRFKNSFSSLIVGEITGTGGLASATYHAATAAKQMTGDIHVHVVGSAQAAEEASKISGVSKVFFQEHEEKLPAEQLAPIIQAVFDEGSYNNIIAGSTFFSKDVLPRLAGLMEVQPITEIIHIEGEDTFQRPMYAGNALQQITVPYNPKIMTIRTTAFDRAEADGNGEVVVVSYAVPEGNLKILGEEIVKSDRPELSGAKIVVSGGRGLKEKENFSMIEELADVLGAAVGATRAIVDSEWVPNDMQVGQTGKVVAPGLYIAAGISGAIQHLAGMKDSKVIVSINTDPEAPIFSITDYGLIGDCTKLLPELIEKLKQ